MHKSITSPARPSNLLKDADFLKFWAGQTISVFGSAITDLALPLTAVLFLNADSTAMGRLSVFSNLPFVLGTLFVGVWADRYRRRPMLIGADLARTLFLGAIPLAAVLGALRLELLFALVFLAGVARVFFDVSYQAYIPTLVGREHLVEGNSKLEISSSVALIAGPSLAGLLVRLVSAPIAIAFNAVSFLLSALALASIRVPEKVPQRQAHNPSVWREIWDGLHVIFGNPVLRSIAACTATFNLFTNMWQAIYVLYLTRDLGLSPEVIGLIFTAAAPGALLGALSASRISKRLGLGHTIIAAPFLCSLGALLVPLTHGLAAFGESITTVAMLATSGFIMGFSNVTYNVNQVSLRQSITPGRLLGRMNASMRFLAWGMLPLGGFIGGELGSRIGVQRAIIVGVSGALLAFLWVLFSPVRSLREQPRVSEE